MTETWRYEAYIVDVFDPVMGRYDTGGDSPLPEIPSGFPGEFELPVSSGPMSGPWVVLASFQASAQSGVRTVHVARPWRVIL